jgi:hypothetical protein
MLINPFSYSLIPISASINIRSLHPLFILALKRSGGWDIVVEWVSTPEPDSKRSRLERGLQIDPFSSFSVAASQLAESGGYFTIFSAYPESMVLITRFRPSKKYLSRDTVTSNFFLYKKS